MQALEDIDPVKRELLRAMIGGVSAADLAWASGSPPDRVRSMAHEALLELDPGLAEQLDPEVRDRVADYLLLRQSPGQAAGTWALLQESREGRRWALWVRESLAELYDGDVPSIPGLDDAPSAGPRRRQSEPASLHDRRNQRRTARARARREAEARQERSPFREEAITHFREGRVSARLPHYASRPLRWALWALLALAAAGLAMCATVSVSTFRQAQAMVVDLPHPFPGGAHGQAMLVFVPAAERSAMHRGATVRVQLPEATGSVSTRLLYVEPRVLSAHDAITTFALPTYLARRVQGPVGVGVASMRVPAGGPGAQSYRDAVSTSAKIHVGSATVLSLVF